MEQILREYIFCEHRCWVMVQLQRALWRGRNHFYSPKGTRIEMVSDDWRVKAREVLESDLSQSLTENCGTDYVPTKDQCGLLIGCHALSCDKGLFPEHASSSLVMDQYISVMRSLHLQTADTFLGLATSIRLPMEHPQYGPSVINQ